MAARKYSESLAPSLPPLHSLIAPQPRVTPRPAMDSPDELAGTTPPPKRRRTHDALLLQRPRSRSSGASQGGDVLSRSPATQPSDDGYSSHSNSRSCTRPRSGSRSTADSSSRSGSASPSPSRSPSQDSPLGRRAGSHSSYDGSESYSPGAPQPTPPREDEPLKPSYKPRLILHGHTKPVSQVRISPNGRFIASASADATLKIWDAATGAHMDTLVGHMAGVSCLAWTPDSNTLASGSDDKAIRLWDRVTGRPKITTRKSMSSGPGRSTLRGHHNYIHCLAFSPKGNILASGSYDEAVFLWDVRARRMMRSLPAHSDPVSGIDFCRDGTLVVSCSTDGLMWDALAW